MSENNGRLVIFLSVVGVVAAVISAATDVFGLLKDDPAPPAGPAGQAATSAPVTSTSATPPKEYAFVLDFGYDGVDLDAEPPARGPVNRLNVLDFRLEESPLMLAGYGISSKNVVQWTGNRAPTYQECKDKLGAESVHRAPVARGRTFCVRTYGERIGLLTAVGPKDDGWEMKALLWEP